MDEQSIFSMALSKSSTGERDAFLDEACAGDAQLRRGVEALLRAHENPDRFLNACAVQLLPTIAAAAIPEPLGTVIGPYKLMEQIGEGGMGLVYVAEQHQPVRRKVALKLIKPGMDTRQVIARFEAERQALALMDHPNIARVIDGGATTSGRPSFVMELVRGVPITEYCDEQRMTPRARLELFRQVCAAVQHAHQKGIIHRDIKPSNVLVVSHDGTPVVKVIDFGVAKAIGQQLTEKTVYTQFAQFIGTPLYMSPEQAGESGLDIDTRTDIYALGVLLYELLTGATPFDRDRIRDADYHEIRRIIREEEPPRPSTRMSTLNQQAGSTVSAQRQTSPRELSILLRGELDWIVMKSLEKDRNRRYDTPSALAADVERYLKEEPVLAGPPTSSYRLRKFLGRNRGSVMAAATLLLALVGGIVGTTWGLFEAHSERDKAVTEKQRADEQSAIAKAVTDFLQNALLSQVDVDKQMQEGQQGDPDMKVRTLLDRAAKTLDGKFLDQPLTESAMRFTIGRAYRELGVYASAEPHLKRSVQLQQANLGADHHDTLTGKNELAILYNETGRFREAIALYEEILKSPGHNRWSNVVSFNLARAYETADRLDEAIAMYEQVRKNSPNMPQAMVSLGEAYIRSGRLTEGTALLEQALESLKTGPDSRLKLSTMATLAHENAKAGKLDKALPLLEQNLEKQKATLGPNHIDTLRSMNHLALAYQDAGELEKAERLMVDLAERARGNGGLSPVAIASILDMLGNNLRKQQKYAAAKRILQEALGMRRELIKSGLCSQLDIAFSLCSLGLNLSRQEKYAEATPFLQDGVAVYAKMMTDDWNRFVCTAALGEALLGQKKYQDAEPLLLEGFAGMKRHETKVPVLSRTWLARTAENIVRLYEATDRLENTREWREKLPTSKSPTSQK